MAIDIEQYRQYRQVQVELHTKILNSLVHEAEFKEAAGLVDILDNRNRVVFQSTVEPDSLMDFNIYEKIRSGKSTLSLFAESYSTEHPLEQELLAAMLQAETSLYEVVRIDKDESVVILNDILNSGNEPVKLVDLGLSSVVKLDSLVFARILHLQEHCITSGLGYLFSGNHRDYLLNKSRKMLKKIKTGDASADRFVAFFHLNRSDGLPVMYETVK